MLNHPAFFTVYRVPTCETSAPSQTFVRLAARSNCTVQSGTVTFDTILPGRYSGRAAHIHFEVFADESLQQSLLVSQMAFDDDLVDSLYEQAGYASSLQHDTDNGRDRIFADGVDQQLLTITGDGGTPITAYVAKPAGSGCSSLPPWSPPSSGRT